MDTSQWSQEAAKAEMSTTAAAVVPKISERKIGRKNDKKKADCPRCNSNNTKFCYYNNYSLTQPRHYCKTCRRYWTEGGSLRHIPVGGGSRKNKRSVAATSSSSTPYYYSSSSFMQNPKFMNLGFQFQVGGVSEVLGLQEFRGSGLGLGLGLGFQVGAGGACFSDEGRFLFGSSATNGGDLEENGMMGDGGNW